MLRPVPICCPHGRKASVPIPWGLGSSSLCKGTVSSVLGRHGTSHSAGHAEWGWYGAQDHTKAHIYAQHRWHHPRHRVWRGNALGLGGSGGPGSLSAWACQPRFPFHRDTRRVTQTPHASAPSLCSWDNILPCLENKCITGCEVLRYSGKEGHVSTSAEWVCLSSHHSDLQSSLPRETSCSSAIYDPPLKSTLPMTQPTGFKVCSVLTFI